MRPPAQSCPEATIRRPPAPPAGWGLRNKKAASALQGCRGCGCRPGPPGAPSPSWDTVTSLSPSEIRHRHLSANARGRAGGRHPGVLVSPRLGLGWCWGAQHLP